MPSTASFSATFPGLIMKQGDKVRWYLLGMGNEIDLHTPHWHGETVTDGRRNTDVIELLPGSMATVDMLADNPGLGCFTAMWKITWRLE